ncbi:MAG: pullulanase-type alpha-1,6-glucosidase [Flavobacteriales bacterium]|jgi:pullulanase-type alpha-1,6-glucosidase
MIRLRGWPCLSFTHTKTILLILFSALFITACGGDDIGSNTNEPKTDENSDVVYFVMSDRFDNGDSANDTGGIDGDRTENGFDATDESFYHGGDIEGLRARLPYLQNLGVTSVWMTPAFKNSPVAIDGNSASYHGYWIQDYMQVDPHLGTNDEMKAFINEAHDLDIEVYFDIVINHTADVIRYEECHDTNGNALSGSDCAYRDTSQNAYTPFLPAGQESAKNPEWLNDTANYHNRGDSSFSGESDELGDFFGLDDVNTEDPAVVQGMVDIYKYWIGEFDIDGFRLDTVKHVNIEFWQEWTPAIQTYAESLGKENFRIFGEIFDGNPANISRYTSEGSLPSALDFGLYFAMRDVFANNVAPTRLADMFNQDDYYNDADTSANDLMTFASNHDIGRIANDIIIANPTETQAQHLARVQQAYALIFFGRGTPVIYYGDEQGFVGGDGDRASREDMMPSLVDNQNTKDLLGTDATTAESNFDEEHPIFVALRDFSDVLKENPVLHDGVQYPRYASDAPGIFAISRMKAGVSYEYLVVLNTSTSEQDASLASMADSYSVVYPADTDDIDSIGGEIELTLPPLSTMVLKSSTEVTDGAELAGVSLGLISGSRVKGLIEIPAIVTLADDNVAVPLIEVSFEVSVDGEEFTVIATDKNADYRAFFDMADIPDETVLSFRATARDHAGRVRGSDPVEVEVGSEPGLKVYFKTPDSWTDSVNIYYWDAEPPVSWPGIAMDAIGDGWFSYQFADGADSANIIFNDGTNQTGDLFQNTTETCFVDTAWAAECEPPTLGMLITFKAPDGWADAVNIHYWDAPPTADTNWPGAAMTSLGDSYFEYQFPLNVSSANIIFNDGSNQTADLNRTGDGCYIDDAWEDTCNAETPEIPDDGILNIYFQKPDAWADAINMYYWEAAAVPDAVWPGVLMTDLGDGWYVFNFPAGVTSSNIIFNDGSNQTADLNRDQDGCYVDGVWVDSCLSPVQGLLLTFVAPAGWSDSINAYYWEADGSVADAVWPGAAMEQVAPGWFQYRLPVGATSANIIFNDDVGNQTPDLFRDGDGCYGVSSSDWTDACDIPTQVEVLGFRAHFVDSSTIAWQTRSSNTASYKLFGSATASLTVNGNTFDGADAEYALTSGATLSESVIAKFRHLDDFPVFTISIVEAELKTLLQSQLVIAAFDDSGTMLEATRLHLPGVIDELFTTDAPLGLQVNDADVGVSVWAPTAQEVLLNIYDADKILLDTVSASATNNGVYTFSGDASWLDLFYKFEVTVYHPASDAIESYEVTDPYSLSLSTNSQYSQFIDLAGDGSLKPSDWDTLVKTLPEKRNISIYEGHVSDFSDSDALVDAADRGKFNAFTYNGENGAVLSNGMAHLKTLATAGLTHFHLLPVNDIATINEDTSQTFKLDDLYSRACELSDATVVQNGCTEFVGMTIREAFEQLVATDPVNERIQAIAGALTNVDPTNWGYDPYHFLAIEGSYASDPDGKTRILEFRSMVKALDEIGLNTVVDVVFNHTNSSGVNDRSVLDKVVPGYYHRLDPLTGDVESSTCCDNTAAEHAMMERLMVDTVTLWAEHYKIDAFRFDLMGHHPASTMLNIQSALAELDVTSNGIEGNKVYLYGEGWDFGEVSGNQRFEQASQFNMGGTEIGTFNDRLRSAVRGGNFTSNGRAQGLGNGNGTYPNGVVAGASTVQDQADRVRIGLAGNLRDYTFIDNTDTVNTGFGYAGVGYGLSPIDNVVYIDKHDNEALWDNAQAKHPDSLSMANRVRAHLLSQSFVNFAQGVPFHQMGTDILRSKSMDRNSFDSGPWANRVDFSLTTTNWASGLPIASENGTRWDAISTIMSNPNIDPQMADMQLATDGFQEQLQIRYSSDLFRLGTGDDVKERVSFWNTGSAQTAGVIAMSVSDGTCAGTDMDSDLDGLMIIFNADDDAQTITIADFAGYNFNLHGVQLTSTDTTVGDSSFDATTGTFSVPGLTTAVFVNPQAGAQGSFHCNAQNGTVIEPGFTVYVEKPPEWTDIRIFYWDTTPVTNAVDWPGVEMTDIGSDWYSFIMPDGVTASNIVFNNNNDGLQTADLSRTGDGCYNAGTDVWTDTCNFPGLTLTFLKPDAWGTDLHLYFFNAPVSNPAWPGTPMTDLGDGFYQLQLPAGVRSSSIIFNDNNGNQTADLTHNSDDCYSTDGGWGACSAP